MKLIKLILSYTYQLMFVISVLAILAAATSSYASANTATSSSQAHLNGGYSALKLFLEDEQHLTLIRRTKSVLTFSAISAPSTKLIDEIAAASETALDELEQLAAASPGIKFEDLSEHFIAKATLNSMRMETAIDFLVSGEDFEKSLLVSQMQVLRVISHLAKQLEQNEPNARRKAWLNQLASQFENYYQQVFARLSITAKGKA